MVVQESNLNKRVSGLYNIVDGVGNFVCDPIAVDLTKSCKVKFVNTATLFEKIMGYIGEDYFGSSKVTLLDANENGLATFYIGTVQKGAIWATELDGNDYVGDLVNIFDLSIAVAGSVPTPEQVAHVVFTLNISNTTITMASLDGIEIQMP